MVLVNGSWATSPIQGLVDRPVCVSASNSASDSTAVGSEAGVATSRKGRFAISARAEARNNLRTAVAVGSKTTSPLWTFVLGFMTPHISFQEEGGVYAWLGRIASHDFRLRPSILRTMAPHQTALSSWRSWTELNPGTLAWVMRRRVHRRCFAIQ